MRYALLLFAGVVFFTLFSTTLVRAESAQASGMYAGMHSGYATGMTKADGAVLGVQVGYNRWYENILVGIEADATYGSIEGEVPLDNFLSIHGDTSVLSSIRARFGMKFDEHRTFVYFTGGPAAAQTKAEMRCAPGATLGLCAISGPFRASDARWIYGWTFGGGAQYALTPDISLGAEYRRYMFSEKTFSFATPIGAVSGTSDLNMHLFLLTISKSF